MFANAVMMARDERIRREVIRMYVVGKPARIGHTVTFDSGRSAMEMNTDAVTLTPELIDRLALKPFLREL